MKISLNWLHDFVDFDESPEQIAEILTFLNFECEGIEYIKRYVNGVRVGKVLEAIPHPNADKLQLTKVDIGGEILPIVCGAPNCREGLIVPVATVGTRIGEFTIESRKLRGEMSQGMILSESEMKISESHGGILELGDDFKVGDDFSKAVPAEDAVLEFEVTVNRPDALSHIGMARELASHWRRPLRLPSFEVQETSTRNVEDELRIDIVAPEQCPRYVGRKVTGVSVQDSPLWMKARLSSIGQRPISNVVDITNYILFELGQPLHAFDADKVKDGRIIVRMAEEGEDFVTLDDKSRKLVSTDLMIADPEKGIALGGVMGGANSEVTDSTNDVIIEAAYFDPPTIRKTAKRLALPSEASRRFERGADPGMQANAAARCAELFRLYAGAEVLQGVVDACPIPYQRPPVNYRPERAGVVLGFEVSKSDAIKVFESLEFGVEEKGDIVVVTPPSWRHDIEREIDLVEEVARHVGYDKVPTAEESHVVLSNEDPPLERILDTAVDSMVAMGFHEAICSAMTSGDDHEAFAGGLKPFEIQRSINPEMNVYRASLAPGLLRVVEHNLNRGLEDIFVFEVGQVGGMGWLGCEGEQRLHLSFAMVGQRIPQSYDRSSEPVDLADVVTVLNELARGLTLDLPLEFSYDSCDNLMLGVKVAADNDDIAGVAGLLKAEVGERFGIDQPVYMAELDLERWVKPVAGELRLPGNNGGYKRFSRFPSSTRDVSFIVPITTPAEEVRRVLQNHSNELLEDVVLFDLYSGEPLATGERSLAFRLVFRAVDRTLTDGDIDPVIETVISEVEKLKGVRLRG
ncbi:phenylalanine--tRNA ligase beta subunit [bacterium BMS3Bbin04]|nr:phenylalanine--tRNA ligase beta subunit [bacterium BMS3Bbin04]